ETHRKAQHLDPATPRHPIMAQLVKGNEQSQRDAEGDQGKKHDCPLAPLFTKLKSLSPRVAVQLEHCFERIDDRAGLAPHGLKALLDDTGDAGERNASAQEMIDGDL